MVLTHSSEIVLCAYREIRNASIVPRRLWRLICIIFWFYVGEISYHINPGMSVIADRSVLSTREKDTNIKAYQLSEFVIAYV